MERDIEGWTWWVALLAIVLILLVARVFDSPSLFGYERGTGQINSSLEQPISGGP